MLNLVVLEGRATKDIVVKDLNKGEVKVANFSIAVDVYDTKAKANLTSFFNCVAWNKDAETLAKCVKKGNLVGIEGYLRQTTYKAKDGSDRQAVDVVVNRVHLMPNKSDDTHYIKEADKSVDGNDIPAVDDLPF